MTCSNTFAFKTRHTIVRCIPEMSANPSLDRWPNVDSKCMRFEDASNDGSTCNVHLSQAPGQDPQVVKLSAILLAFSLLYSKYS